jgi:hypothetical protein
MNKTGSKVITTRLTDVINIMNNHHKTNDTVDVGMIEPSLICERFETSNINVPPRNLHC